MYRQWIILGTVMTKWKKKIEKLIMYQDEGPFLITLMKRERSRVRVRERWRREEGGGEGEKTNGGEKWQIRDRESGREKALEIKKGETGGERQGKRDETREKAREGAFVTHPPRPS